MCKTTEGFLAEQRGEEVVTDFGRLYSEHRKLMEDEAVEDEAARLSLSYLSRESYEAMVRFGEEEEERRRQVDREVRELGDVAIEWYASTGQQHYLPARLFVPQPTTRMRGTRRLASGRPRARRTTTASRDGPEDGESDPPGVGAAGGVGTSRVFVAPLREGATP